MALDALHDRRGDRQCRAYRCRKVGPDPEASGPEVRAGAMAYDEGRGDDPVRRRDAPARGASLVRGPRDRARLLQAKEKPGRAIMTSRGSRPGEFAVCIQNGEYEADLIVGKLYRVVKPERNDRASDIRVVDESGDDYLYPRGWF